MGLHIFNVHKVSVYAVLALSNFCIAVLSRKKKENKIRV